MWNAGLNSRPARDWLSDWNRNAATPLSLFFSFLVLVFFWGGHRCWDVLYLSGSSYSFSIEFAADSPPSEPPQSGHIFW